MRYVKIVRPLPGELKKSESESESGNSHFLFLLRRNT
jgi:hypothetical protein